MPAQTLSAVQRITPILHCDDAVKAADWYSRLGFEVTATYQPDPDDPRFITLRANGLWLFLSEHEGDASPAPLVYFPVEDVDQVARPLGVAPEDMPWGMREIHLPDPAGNRVRVGAGVTET